MLMWSDSRWLAVVTVLLGYAVLCLWVRRRYRRLKAEALRARESLMSGSVGTGADESTVWVAYASQTGQAEALAWQSAQALHAAGCPTRVLSMEEFTATELRTASRVLFVVSTHGEGDPPDSALAFVRDCIEAVPALRLPQMHHAVLALGDRDYRHFCGFGRQLDAWLTASGATPMFERIELHREDPEALQRWRQQLGHLAGTTDLPDWQAAAPFAAFRLVERRCLNPGSVGRPAFHLALLPCDTDTGIPVPLPAWEAGDLVQIEPPPWGSGSGSGDRPREYSIASLPGEGRLQLLVRQHADTDAQGRPRLGRVSGWLTTQCLLGQPVMLRVRAHPNFRLGSNADRPLVLVGNGTGLAGLRAHLQARAEAVARSGRPAPSRCAWLLFGERTQAHDQFYADDLAGWQVSGVLSRLDLVFSRDRHSARPAATPYVQDRLLACAETLRDWVAAGAALYVCGSLHGMATGVDHALREILGDAEVDRLLATGRLRRDVY